MAGLTSRRSNDAGSSGARRRRRPTASGEGRCLARDARLGGRDGATRAAAAEIDDLGYGALWFGEAHSGKEIFSNLGVVLAATRRMVVASGIANIWVRDATAMNAGANTLSRRPTRAGSCSGWVSAIRRSSRLAGSSTGGRSRR